MPEQLGFRGRMISVLKALAPALLVVMIAGIVYEQVGQRRDARRLPQIGRSVDIGGRNLNIHCSGEGSPAAILDSGNGDPGIVWSEIQIEIAKFTQVCWYDRAGQGWSDPGPFPRTSAAMATDLHELLQRANIPGPYILVGHSLGGMNARVYNGLYPEDLAGAVLVDAAHEDEPRRAPDFILAPFRPPRYLWRPIWITGQVALATGLIRLMAPKVALPANHGEYTREQVIRALRQQPKALATQADATLPESYAQAERAGGFGDRPLIVLTRGRIDLPANPRAMDLEYAAYMRVWMHEIQPKLARLSTRGQQIIVPHSGHRIHEDAPDAVITAVRTVVTEVRAVRSPLIRRTTRSPAVPEQTAAVSRR